MDQILFVNACVRPGSRTLELAQSVLTALPGQIQEVCLAKETIPPLDWAGLQAREAGTAAGDFSGPCFRYARQFAQADRIVIAAPYWDLLFPAALRAYLEAVTVGEVTFRYGHSGIPEGLCRAKSLYYVTTAGGPIEDQNFGYAYVEALARGFYGIPEVRCFSAEGLDVHGADVSVILAAAKAAVRTQLAR